MIKTVPSAPVRIYIAGNYDDAARICREFCQRGACVRLTHTSYIYTGGQEDGVEVAFINYPRFPAQLAEIEGQAMALALMLLDGLFQHSCSIEGPSQTTWVSRRKEDYT
jgi:hypothetical protein